MTYNAHSCVRPERKEEILAGTQKQRGILSTDALARLNKLEESDPQKADSIKDKLLAERAHWRLNGPVSDEYMQMLIEGEKKEAVATDAKGPASMGGRGVMMDRRRFGDGDSDSDIDLDGL